MDCGTLNNPTNGKVSYTGRTTFGQTATYSCNTGYSLVGDSSRTCQATGNWSGSVPTCQGILLKSNNLILILCGFYNSVYLGLVCSELTCKPMERYAFCGSKKRGGGDLGTIITWCGYQETWGECRGGQLHVRALEASFLLLQLSISWTSRVLPSNGVHENNNWSNLIHLMPCTWQVFAGVPHF